MICPNCGSNLPDKALFCTNCGTKLTPPVEEAPAPQAAPAAPVEPVTEQNQPMPEQTYEPVQPQPQPEEAYQPQPQPNYQQQPYQQPQQSQQPQQQPYQQPQQPQQPYAPGPMNGPQQGVPNGFEQGMNPFTQPQQPKKKKSLLWLWITLAVVVIAGIAAAAFLLLRGGKVTLDLNKYVTYSFEGYNDYGSAVIDFDYDSFTKDYRGKIHYNNDKKYDATEDIIYEFDGEIDSDDGELSNGDEVTLTWLIDRESVESTYNVKLKYSDMTFTVEGLEDVDVFDPFEGLEVTFKGTDGKGYMTVDTANCANKAAKDLWFNYDYRSDYKNGDTVTVTFDPYGDVSYIVDSYGEAPYPTTKEYTVEGLTSYIADDSLLTDTALEPLKTQAENIYNAYVASHFDKDDTLNSLDYVGYVLLTTKGEVSEWENNELFLVYKANISSKFTDYMDGNKEKTETRDVYWYTSFENIMPDEDGITTDLQSYDTPWDSVSFEKSWSYFDGYESKEDLRKKVCDANAVDWNVFDKLGK